MLSVVFATHNGAQTLPRTLESFTCLQEPPGGWKLIAVDNASSDGTPAILQSFADRLPMTILNQPERGKNRALNLAIPELEGGLAVFTDDDVIAEDDWLVQLRRAADTHPDYDIFGGRISPVWPHEPPDWFLRAIPVSIAFGAIGDEKDLEGPVQPGMIWGANMALRKAIFDDGHRFDDTVGPQGGQYRMGGETEFTTRLANRGHKAWHCSTARVGHIVRVHQLDTKWVVARAFRFGRDMFWKENEPALALETAQRARRSPTRVAGVPRWVYRRLFEEALRAMVARLRGDRGTWLKASWNRQYWQGYLSEAFSQEGRTLLARRKPWRQANAN